MVSYHIFLFSIFLLLCLLYTSAYCICEGKAENTTSTSGNSKDTRSYFQRTKIINSLKKKTNEIRMIYNTLNAKNADTPLYIFVKDNDENKRIILKNLFLMGNLDFLQGLNTPFSKFYLSMRIQQRTHREQVESQIRNEREFINTLDTENKKRYVMEKLRDYKLLKANIQQFYSRIGKRFKSVEELMTRLNENAKN
ncbi:hypothetical protein, conserved [Plasmodium gonderi]|uniref:Uncharacterized protein n=1 Tax=Plasmodium gonderi TaxID=77519 RepID=A0A1Y1JHH6_PLAGO|nr:hypothetical protein, conserved [Plasmodium gonderi]GAW81976.1 hypothetical protein, conserved [Plasmodium gonderi]